MQRIQNIIPRLYKKNESVPQPEPELESEPETEEDDEFSDVPINRPSTEIEYLGEIIEEINENGKRSV
ncbi:hypothetical protein BpHYR1_002952 [Brachionus plicatilis]|uniref:Uncharacterized protein n=1 Tax=Brachionus plicatilis TaxID=10195 RepID=A0A3M7T4E2_BRAPC|nr:hypothetical protein BpHYR1_002952 [Brachionus plicatilis]